ncbi:MAG: hypothetical protein ACK5NB_00275 [Flavobacteriaceae bacterium]
MLRLIIMLFIFPLALNAQTPIGDELVGLHNVETTEISNITNPIEGSIFYSPTDKNVYVYTNTGWKALASTTATVFTGFFIIPAPDPATQTTVTVSNIPFQPSQVTFVAHANVESVNLDSDNGVSNNTAGLKNAFGTMNGFANANTNTQQVIFIGGNGNSINDISRYASSTHCVGVRFTDQDGNDLGLIEGSISSYNTNGFTLLVNYTDGTISTGLSSSDKNRIRPDDVREEGSRCTFYRL